MPARHCPSRSWSTTTGSVLIEPCPVDVDSDLGSQFTCYRYCSKAIEPMGPGKSIYHACRCDEKCHFFGDCCADSPKATQPALETAECAVLDLVKIGSQKKEYYSMIMKCLKSYKNQEFIRKCTVMSLEDWKSWVPINVDDLTYRNVYCAFCNGADLTNGKVESWTLGVDDRKCRFNVEAMETLKDLTALTYQLQHGNSKFGRICNFIPSSKKARSCETHMTDTTCLPNADPLLKKLCQNEPTSVVYTHENGYFKNAFCALCNNVSKIDMGQCKREYMGATDLSIVDMLDFSSELVSGLTTTDNCTQNCTLPSETTTEFIISVSCIGVSMVTTLCMALLVSIKPDLRTNNAKNLLLLAINIMLSSIFFIFISLYRTVLNYPRWFCKFLAFGYYFFNLSTFLWSLAIGWDLYKVLGKDSVSSGGGPSFVRNCIKVTSFASFITLVLLVLDLLVPSNAFLPQFGANLCWINTLYGHILFYFTPVVLTLVLNGVLFAITSWKLRQTMKSGANIRSTNTNSDSHIIILKIALIIGLPNIFVFGIVLIDGAKYPTVKSIFEHINSVIYGLQGAILCINFLISKQSRTEIQNTFTRRNTKSVKQPTTSTSVQGKPQAEELVEKE